MLPSKTDSQCEPYDPLPDIYSHCGCVSYTALKLLNVREETMALGV